MKNPTAIFFLKMFDIFLLTVYYFISAFYISTGVDYFMGRYESGDDKLKPTWKLFLEAIWYTFVLLFVFYIVRNIVSMIPFPLEGLFGFRHELVKERGGDVVFVFILFFYQEYYTKKLNYLYKRIMFGYYGDETQPRQPKETGERVEYIK